MSICKSSLEKIGKAAFNALSPEDQQKYLTASNVVGIISGIVKGGITPDTFGNLSGVISQVGINIGTDAIILLANKLCGKDYATLTDALKGLAGYITNSISSLVDQIKHDIANKLAVLFGIDENPGILGAIMEWVYKSIIKPIFA